MKRANHGTKLQGTPQDTPSVPPADPAAKNPQDARDDDAQLAENQQDLGVGKDHKTEDMEEGGRGTFP
jgi:hypothetical protein